MAGSVTLTINGQTYRRWTAVRVKRSLKQVAAAFSIETPGEIHPPILPFARCVLADAGMPVVTGFVDGVAIDVDARSTRTRITGRSLTGQLVDCMMEDFATNQFSHSNLQQIASAVAAKFDINTVVGPGVNVGGPFPDATFEWSETAFRFLERLARQRGVMLTDDPSGNLVLATLGTASAPANLATGQGGNVFAVRGLLSGKQRYSQYSIRSQQGLLQTGNGQTNDQVHGQASDGTVPMHRPWASIAESSLNQADAQIRAAWEAAHRLGQSVTAVLSVPEWMANGTLWQCNQLAQCTVPRLDLAGTMLIGAVEFTEDGRGRRTELTVAPPAAFQPEPQITAQSKGVAAGGGWEGITPVSPGAAGGASGGGPSSAAVSSSSTPLT